jgi:FecR protein
MLRRCAVIALVLYMITVSLSLAATAAELGASEAVVTAIQGNARIYGKDSTTGRLLKKGDVIKRENEVKVAEKSRIEIRFPDGTVMRLSEKSHLKMSELSFNKQTDSKKVKVDLSLGKLWAKVKRLTTSDSSVEVKTTNAVAGVRGTVYRVNVEEDKSALVKVYDGTVYVANPPRDASKSLDKSIAPHEVSGPREVPPPYHEVSMEEWTAIVNAMQQISISPEGKPSKPEDFDPKADSDEWVKWNQERDKQVDF